MLGAISIVFCAVWIAATEEISSGKDAAAALFTSITQGILAAGASVYANQIYVQANKENE